ncbi:hypothetical protein FKR81_23590 [Lentzea tibetensis]|uniref:Uncharacterized protein n=1 Tax=Lentzea tibetensis TaxID=2591470 RepID=A0A563EQ50_9PSEU|nr:hypothetical protein [Lentzea tibetensis]TWP49527.1 hypothetical protein FKR81_23590 [Lentzea tibetensis]
MTDLPPFQPLPDHVRDKARQELVEGLDRKPPAWRGPLTIAATVAALAAGAVVTGQAIWSPGTTPLATPPTSGPPQFQGLDMTELYDIKRSFAPPGMAERCAAAKPENPPVAQWRPVLSVFSNGVTIAAFEVPAGRIFCTTTATTAAVSAPVRQELGGAPARILFAAPNGAIAGLVPPGVRHLGVNRSLPVGNHTIVSGGHAAVVDSLFLVPGGFSRAGDPSSFLIDGDEVPIADVPAVTPPVVDRPQPPAERTSEAGQRLQACLADQQFAVPDRDQFVAGAHVKFSEQSEVQLGRFGDLLLQCRYQAGQELMMLVQDHVGAGEGQRYNTISAEWYYFDFRADENGSSSSDKRAIVGQVLDQRATSITATAPGLPEQSAVISNGTYVLPGPVPPDTTAKITVKDASGAVLEEISLRE